MKVSQFYCCITKDDGHACTEHWHEKLLLWRLLTLRSVMDLQRPEVEGLQGGEVLQRLSKVSGPIIADAIRTASHRFRMRYNSIRTLCVF